MNHIESVCEKLPMSLEEVGLSGAAEALRARISKLDNRSELEQLVAALEPLGPTLVQKYLRAGKFLAQAAPGIRADAAKYQQDLFTARCHVAAAREAAKRALRGDTSLN